MTATEEIKIICKFQVDASFPFFNMYFEVVQGYILRQCHGDRR